MKEQEIEVNTNIKVNENKGKKTDNNDNNNFTSYCLMLWYIFLTFILFSALVYLFFLMNYNNKKTKVLVSEKNMPKSLVDNRKYRAIKLPNNLDVVLVQDPSTKRSAVSLTVGVGYFSDPEKAQGLASLTQHLIFSGSKTYNKPSEFEDHLSLHYGSINSFSEEEKSSFYFDIDSEGFEKALHMFSRMFAEPVFNEDHIIRHLDIMEKQSQKTLKDDQWKERHLIKQLAHPAHPFSRVSHGNYTQMRKADSKFLKHEVNVFYNKFYIPQSMKLVISSSMNLEQQQIIAEEYFSDLRTDSKDIYRYGQLETELVKPYSLNELSKVLWYQKEPSYSQPTLDLIFILDSILSPEAVNVKPLDYVTYLLKHKGFGSLSLYLVKKNLASKLDVGVIGSFRTFSQYAISIDLTEEGLKNYNKVIELVFGFLNKLRNKTQKYVNENMYNQIQQISYKNFKFLNYPQNKISNFLTDVSMNMLDYQPENFISNEFLHKVFNATLIDSYIENLIPENLLIIIGSYTQPQGIKKEISEKDPKSNKMKKIIEDKFYGVRYFASKISNIENLRSASHKFKVRVENNFISKETELISCYGRGDTREISNAYNKNRFNKNYTKSCFNEKISYKPKLIVNGQKIKVWHKEDRSYLAPKVNTYLNVLTIFLRNDTNNMAMLQLFYQFVKNSIEIELSDAIDAGNIINLKMDNNGIQIHLDTFIDKLDPILKIITTIIFDPKYLQESVNEKVVKNLILGTTTRLMFDVMSDRLQKINQIFLSIVKKGMISRRLTAGHLLKIKNTITVNEFLGSINNFRKELDLIVLFYGALSINNVKNTNKKIFKNYFNIKTNITNSDKNMQAYFLIDKLHSHKYIDGSFVYKKDADFNHAYIANYYQIGIRNTRLTLHAKLIELIWGNMLKYQIGIAKKLGEILSAKLEEIDNHLVIIVF